MSDRREIDTGSPDLLAHVEGRIATLTMNRPARRNALSAGMLQGLAAALAEAELAPDVGCVVLTGAEGAFCAGGDVKGMSESHTRSDSDAGERRATLDEAIHQQRLSQRETAGRLWKMPKPTIAMLPGPAAGAGLSLALACDFRVASADAILTTAFAKVGFAGDYGGTFFMTQLIGAAKTRELYFLSERLDAAEAERLGLVHRVVPAAELEKATFELAGRLARGPAVAYRYMKENINRAATGGDVDECLDLEATHHVHSGLTRDHKNAVQAFMEKRTPEFEGR